MIRSQKPVTQKTALVTRAKHQAHKLVTALQKIGVEPIIFPTIEITPLDDKTTLDTAIKTIDQYHWLMFSSTNSVKLFFQRLQALNYTIDQLHHLSIAVIGPATAEILRHYHLEPTLIPPIHKAEGLLQALQPFNLAHQHILLPQADIARPTLTDGLTHLGAKVNPIPIYQTIPRLYGPCPPMADIVTFTSPSTVQGYVNCLGSYSPTGYLTHSTVICIGPTTAQAAHELTVPVTAIAKPHTIAGLVKAIQQ